ncbi:hypothetical protein, partial [Pararhizobium sp. PWRC1-1]|uniref:hypothetical protein n=1 Tax=Pararhizobium sp. PWRC1-1 TaxID=2804566 RepID=UPI003CE96777
LAPGNRPVKTATNQDRVIGRAMSLWPCYPKGWRGQDAFVPYRFRIKPAYRRKLSRAHLRGSDGKHGDVL